MCQQFLILELCWTFKATKLNHEWFCQHKTVTMSGVNTPAFFDLLEGEVFLRARIRKEIAPESVF